jgi:hypothetical protein
MDKKPPAITPGMESPPAVIHVPKPSVHPGKKPHPVTAGMKNTQASAYTFRIPSSTSQHAQQQTQFNIEHLPPEHWEPLRHPHQHEGDLDYGQFLDDPNDDILTANSVLQHMLYNLLGENYKRDPFAVP